MAGLVDILGLVQFLLPLHPPAVWLPFLEARNTALVRHTPVQQQLQQLLLPLLVCKTRKGL
ncbi:hypothetical protein M406DRAFT_321972 [Cryphonectria parasitica EP155]|uniref:Secreted protein n=1 Tax=Cryphonectria parasitica (strain ATCC 38755 / EP155) TaxID=660469 RepID=A0A9P4Y1Y2_CRYP1|nr:uncharacterized protein M406DRAFT_321972 [Cryphonectria parasitica EP155]KAF3765504.1 hypothetical protein M406DRAFT_321972 [Cryphonectria parasitica EP155]